MDCDSVKNAAHFLCEFVCLQLSDTSLCYAFLHWIEEPFSAKCFLFLKVLNAHSKELAISDNFPLKACYFRVTAYQS